MVFRRFAGVDAVGGGISLKELNRFFEEELTDDEREELASGRARGSPSATSVSVFREEGITARSLSHGLGKGIAGAVPGEEATEATAAASTVVAAKAHPVSIMDRMSIPTCRDEKSPDESGLAHRSTITAHRHLGRPTRMAMLDEMATRGDPGETHPQRSTTESSTPVDKDK